MRFVTLFGTPMLHNNVLTGDVHDAAQSALAEYNGLLRLLPSWVPRSFLIPGKRLRLHEDDLYAFGTDRGGIDERWIASVTAADNANPSPYEGMSICKTEDGTKILFKDMVSSLSENIIGPTLMQEYGRWPVLAKLFDNQKAIPLHIHHGAEAAAKLGKEPKPESYYFPPQYNQHLGDDPVTYFGLKDGVERDDIRRCLERWHDGDNGILDLSVPYPLEPGTGWMVPPGVLHAPGSLCTYEPQWGSDVFSMFQNTMGDHLLDRSLLVKDVPADAQDDIGYLIDLLDWEANTDPQFQEHYQLKPQEIKSGDGWTDKKIVYGTVHGKHLFSAKELTVEPGAQCTIRDNAASGWLTVQGTGKLGSLEIETPDVIRFGDETKDEVFISYDAAVKGVIVKNTGAEPLVGLRHFGPDMMLN